MKNLARALPEGHLRFWLKGRRPTIDRTVHEALRLARFSSAARGPARV